jgi:hypothetical protein
MGKYKDALDIGKCIFIQDCEFESFKLLFLLILIMNGIFEGNFKEDVWYLKCGFRGALSKRDKSWDQ